jgi:hypothetical protein
MTTEAILELAMLTKYYFHTIIPIFKNMPKSGLIKCQ